MAALYTLPNYEFVGATYDILEVDPITFVGTTSSKDKKAFELGDLTQEIVFNNYTYSHPANLTYHAQGGGGKNRTVSELVSSYDFQTFMERSGSIKVTDITGGLYSATASGSFNALKSSNTKNSSVVTYVSTKVTLWNLKVNENCALSDNLKNAIQQLPVPNDKKPDQKYYDFIKNFGTHYLSWAVFGGRATQVIRVDTVDYADLVQNGIDFSGQAELTFGLKANAAAAGKDTRESKFTKSSSLTVEEMKTVGGVFQDYLDSWASNVPNQPMPIEGEFRPLYELLSPLRVLDDAADEEEVSRLTDKKTLLKAAIDIHLAHKGTDPKTSLLKFGDVVELELAVGDGRRILCADKTRLKLVPEDDLTDSSDLPHRWVLMNPVGAVGKTVETGSVGLLLKNEASQMLLDSQSGSDEEYEAGDVLAGAVDSDPKHLSSAWTAELVGRHERTTLVDGDIVRFRSKWKSPTYEQQGYLMGPEDAGDKAQRVYGVGAKKDRGAVWIVRRAPAKPI
jgi:hypothetical protein